MCIFIKGSLTLDIWPHILKNNNALLLRLQMLQKWALNLYAINILRAARLKAQGRRYIYKRTNLKIWLHMNVEIWGYGAVEWSGDKRLLSTLQE